MNFEKNRGTAEKGKPAQTRSSRRRCFKEKRGAKAKFEKEILVHMKLDHKQVLRFLRHFEDHIFFKQLCTFTIGGEERREDCGMRMRPYH